MTLVCHLSFEDCGGHCVQKFPLLAGFIIISEMRNGDHISEKCHLSVNQAKAGRLYLLPKIHKAGNLGPTIVSANVHPIEKMHVLELLTYIFSPMYRIYHLPCRILQAS